MSDYLPIRYVCMSDMHLGAQNSLLTNLTPNNKSSDTKVASPVLTRLVECLRELISTTNKDAVKPTLILAGDILELALTTDNIAAMAFERFIELTLPATGDRLFEKILYIPGNHDHHLWETAREMQYVTHLKQSTQAPGSLLDIPWHATSMFGKPAVPSLFLEGIVRRYEHLEKEKIRTIYPNFALLSDDRRRCAIITHGHFAESLYMLMSTMRRLMFPAAAKPELTWDYEAENFAWIDFFWSTMGRSGEVGTDVEIVYDKLQDDNQVRLLIRNLATGLANRPGRRGWKKWAEARLLKRVLNLMIFAIRNAERTLTDDYLTPDALRGLKAFVEGPILKQIAIERNGNVPPWVAVVFGHTHKPFASQMDFDGYQPGSHVYNTGGWVVDAVSPQPKVGAAIVLSDKDLNLTSLRMYNEAGPGVPYSVSVETASTPHDPPNPFHEQIKRLVTPQTGVWDRFSDEVANEIPRRVANLKSKIEQW